MVDIDRWYIDRQFPKQKNVENGGALHHKMNLAYCLKDN